MYISGPLSEEKNPPSSGPAYGLERCIGMPCDLHGYDHLKWRGLWHTRDRIHRAAASTAWFCPLILNPRP